jgi:hypothetical protein
MMLAWVLIEGVHGDAQRMWQPPGGVWRGSPMTLVVCLVLLGNAALQQPCGTHLFSMVPRATALWATLTPDARSTLCGARKPTPMMIKRSPRGPQKLYARDKGISSTGLLTAVLRAIVWYSMVRFVVDGVENPVDAVQVLLNSVGSKFDLFGFATCALLLFLIMA